jgi:hypothetical protein
VYLFPERENKQNNDFVSSFCTSNITYENVRGMSLAAQFSVCTIAMRGMQIRTLLQQGMSDSAVARAQETLQGNCAAKFAQFFARTRT